MFWRKRVFQRRHHGVACVACLGFHDPDRASVRFSFSRYTTEADIDRALEAVTKVFGTQPAGSKA